MIFDNVISALWVKVEGKCGLISENNFKFISGGCIGLS